MNIPTIRVEAASEQHVNDLARLLTAIREEDHPDQPPDPALVADGLRRSLDHFATLQSDSAWVLIAYLSDQPIGIAVLTRIPKLDARLGFLYLDELHVLAPARRRGVATALLKEAASLARSLGLAGLRLLARTDNHPAQTFYEQAGFRQSPTLLYERRFDPASPQV